MTAPSLVLKYRVNGDDQIHVRGAVRIRVDGCGVLMLYGADNGKAEAVSLNGLRSITIQSVVDLPGCATTTIH